MKKELYQGGKSHSWYSSFLAMQLRLAASQTKKEILGHLV